MNDSTVLKAGEVKKQALEEGELKLINAQSLRTLAEGEVYAFKIAACDTKVDRDIERFTEKCLAQMAKLYVGRPVLMDHHWSAQKQVARIYAAGVEEDGEIKRLIVRAYTPNSEDNKGFIENIETGVLREVSVGAAVSKRTCSICGTEQKNRWRRECEHTPGEKYDDQVCCDLLEAVRDVFEISFVAVPAQPEAGVIRKLYGDSGDGWLDVLAGKIAAKLENRVPVQQQQDPFEEKATGQKPVLDPEIEALIKSSKRLLELTNK